MVSLIGFADAAASCLVSLRLEMNNLVFFSGGLQAGAGDSFFLYIIIIIIKQAGDS